VVWLDGLDVPMVSFFDSSFLERYPEATQPVVRPEGDTQARYGANLLPLGYEQQSLTTPLFCYSYARTRAALEELRNGDCHPCHGLKLQYANPATGGYPMPTIGAFVQLLPAGFRGGSYRATDGTVYSVVEGRGRSHVAGKLIEWEEKDTFVVPSWAPVRHETDADAVLFSFSDRPAQKALGLWREQAPAE
jgi:gentisate 1,2-dioxygenase